MRVDYTVSIWKEGNQFIAHAMPLDVASAGATPEAASNAVDEAMRAFVDSCSRAGTLEQVLEEAGYARGTGGKWHSPSWISLERRELAITT